MVVGDVEVDKAWRSLKVSNFTSKRSLIKFPFSFFPEETHVSDRVNSPVIGHRNVPAATLTPNAASHPASPITASADPWPSQSDEDIDRLVAMHQNRHNSLSSLGVSSETDSNGTKF